MRHTAQPLIALLVVACGPAGDVTSEDGLSLTGSHQTLYLSGPVDLVLDDALAPDTVTIRGGDTVAITEGRDSLTIDAGGSWAEARCSGGGRTVFADETALTVDSPDAVLGSVDATHLRLDVESDAALVAVDLHARSLTLRGGSQGSVQLDHLHVDDVETDLSDDSWLDVTDVRSTEWRHIGRGRARLAATQGHIDRLVVAVSDTATVDLGAIEVTTADIEARDASRVVVAVTGSADVESDDSATVQTGGEEN